MLNHKKIKNILSNRPLFFGIAAVIFAFGLLGFKYYSVSKELGEAKKREIQLQDSVKNLQGELASAEGENANLSDLLQAEKERNDELNLKVDSISSKVGILEKLSQTDKELLQKYSKVYFLNENYVPNKLVSIGEKYLYEKDKESLIHSKVQKYLYKLMDDAESDGVSLLIISAYRSFGEQSVLKTGYATTFGSGASKFSADQGYSEHQLGSALDLTTPNLKSSFTKFGSSSAFEWLLNNAHKYGFILSYPEGNVYYQFEPWHWRFVGITLASDLHDRKINFYDMSQREIDIYLADIFD